MIVTFDSGILASINMMDEDAVSAFRVFRVLFPVLLFSTTFPRSVRFCVGRINELLHVLKNGTVTGGNGAVPAAVKLFAAGDLAWFSEALGKPNMSGDHCCLCHWRCSKGSRKADSKKESTP
jgi:hypothetical protein